IRCLRALPADERPTGVRGWVARAVDVMRRALLDDVPPDAYAIYRLHEPGRAAFVADALFGPEPQWLAGRLARLGGADEADVADKARFADLCRRHGLAVVPTLAVYRDGARDGPQTPFSPDHVALWVKDLRGSRGAGAACWRRDAAGWREADGGPVLSESDLEERWCRGDRLVQPLVIAHPVLAALSAGAAVPDVRVVTGIGRDGDVAVVGAQARLGVGGRPGTRRIVA
ncbi:sugar-transfer associated ATP-grasp domain-containing protein, partial [Oharaeibacter diazotrophicus]